MTATALPLFAILALPESTATTLYGMSEIIESAGRDWPMLESGVPGQSRLRARLVGRDGAAMSIAGGVRVDPAYALADCPRPDVIAIPDLAVAPGEDIAGRYEPELAWLRHWYGQGSMLASACTGALLLAEAGLLDGLDATVHWAYCEAMAARYPTVRVHPNRTLVVTGAEQRLVLGGGGSSWHDLALYLVGRFLGADEAMRVARVQLLDWHHVGQQPYAILSSSRQSDDPLIARCQAWIAQHYDAPSPVAAMVRESGLPERSFKRRFGRATGMSPLEYVHTLRLEEAKHLLETGDAPVEAVANEVGYEDASFFGRLFRRKVGLTPAQYRRRFGALHRALAGAPPPDDQAAGRTRQKTALR